MDFGGFLFFYTWNQLFSVVKILAWYKFIHGSILILLYYSRIFTEEFLKKMTKYAFTWYAKFELTCKSHEKCELHILDNNLYRLVMNRHYIFNNISLWLPIRCAYFKRKVYFGLGTLQVFHFVLGTLQLPFLVNQPTNNNLSI